MSERIVLRVNGMTCNHCVSHVTQALQAVAGVTAAQVSLERGEAVVEGEADAQQLVAAVKAAGYEASPLS
jgi:copper chaperone